MTYRPRKNRDPECHEFGCTTRVELLMKNRCGGCTHFFCDVHLHTPVKPPRTKDYCAMCLQSKGLQ